MSQIAFSAAPDQTRYITVRNYNQERIFHEVSDYQHCLSQLNRVINQYGCALHAYALMPDHMNLLVSSAQTICVIRTLDLFEQAYTNYFNFTHRRIQRKLELEHTLISVDTVYHTLTYYRYIELAPVLIRLVDHPADYHWSSYGCNAMGEDTGLLSPHSKYLSLGSNDQERRQKYRDMFEGCGLEEKTKSSITAMQV